MLHSPIMKTNLPQHTLDHIVLDHATILDRIEEMALTASKKYRGQSPIFLRIQDGADKFADLYEVAARRHGLDFATGTITIKSMAGSESNGEPKIVKDYVGPSISGRDVVLVEDIVDTGLTIDYLIKHLSVLKPKSIKTVALFVKDERRQVSDMEFEDIGFQVTGFVVGFGLDFDDHYRDLPDLWLVKFPEET